MWTIITHAVAFGIGALGSWWVTFKAKIKSDEAIALNDLKLAMADVKAYIATIKTKI